MFQIMRSFPKRFDGSDLDKDDDLTLGDHVNDSIAQVISQMNQTTNLAAELKGRSGVVYAPLDPVQLNPLRVWLEKVSNVRYDSYLDVNKGFLEAATAVGTRPTGLGEVSVGEEFQLIRQEVLRDEHSQASSGKESLQQDPDDVAFEILGMIRHLMGTFLPKGTDLEALYREMGIDTADMDWSQGTRIEGMRSDAPPARPHQLMGSDWIQKQLTSPIRAAILADECGLGKTLQIGMFLVLHCYQTERTLRAGDLTFLEGGRHFKPSVIFYPPAVCHQILKELVKWFGSYLYIAMCYGTRLHPIKPTLKDYILDDSEELEA
ncbi:hypothetical protein Neosp_006845 [[Neocosmospora] mangrovei]